MTESSTPTFISSNPGIPKTRQDILDSVGTVGNHIFAMVRRMLDDLEASAPWDDLYYPPTNTEEFLRRASLLLAVIEAIPQRVTDLLDTLSAHPDEASEEFLGDIDFFFGGIHMSVEQEMMKLGNLLRDLQSRLPQDPSPEERDYTCELSADLKGKYTSSIMGAAASLIAAGKWRGVEIEPILFEEKAAEFERNERLVATLSEVTENIQTLLEQVPLAHLVETWTQGERVDQYSLTPLYSLLGNLGKLMRESSRRALYSGDYHQIQRREGLLAARVNELATLHNMTWGTVPLQPGQTKADIFPLMIQKATELATVLDTNILKSIIGDDQVEAIFHVVAVEKDLNSSIDRWRSGHDIKPHPSREKIPASYHSLVVLLYDEDLNTFLELLLGSVLKRASLTVKKELQATPSENEMSELLSTIEELPQTASAPTQPAVPTEPTGAPAFDPSMFEVDHSFAAEASPGTASTPSFQASVIEPFEPPPEPPLEPAPPAASDMLFAPASLPKLEPTTPSEPLRDREHWDSSSFESELDTLSGPLAGATLGDELDSLSDDFDGEISAPSPSPSVDRQQSFHDASRMRDALERLRAGSPYKSFQLIHRLLKQKRAIPPAMVQSMQPFVASLLSEIVPLLDENLAGLLKVDGPMLAEDCRLLSKPAFTPLDIQNVLPPAMQRLDGLLVGMDEKLQELIDQLSGY